jgi:hypothetical protein
LAVVPQHYSPNAFKLWFLFSHTMTRDEGTEARRRKSADSFHYNGNTGVQNEWKSMNGLHAGVRVLKFIVQYFSMIIQMNITYYSTSIAL